jgi:hypothetical protein
MTKPKKTTLELAQEHWKWIEAVLANRQTETRHMFIEGFLHGYKHGREHNAKKVA